MNRAPNPHNERTVFMIRHLLVAFVATAVIGGETNEKQQPQQARTDAQRSAEIVQTPKEQERVRQAADRSTPDAMDARQFIQEAASSGMFEVKSAQLAKQRATSDNTKLFADHLIQDHKQANDDLMKIAKKMNIEAPTDLQPNEKATFDQLATVNGANFDGQFLQAQVKAHQQAVELFEKASKNLQDKELKEFAQQYLPNLREHLKMAQDNSQFMSTG